MEADPMAALAASADNGEKGAEGGTKRAAETDLATLEQQASQLLDVTEAPGPTAENAAEKAAENEAKKKELVENPEEIELDDEDEEDMDGIAQKTVPAAVFAGVEGGGALERLKKAKKS